MSSFGFSSFGGLGPPLDPGGFGSLPPTYAVATSTNNVRVFLLFQPLYASVSGIGDAKNPLTWAVQNVATGFDFTITTITQIGPTTYDVGILEQMSDRFVLHEVSTTGLFLAAGGVFNPQPDLFFPGTSPSVAPAPYNAPLQDIANPTTPTDIGLAGTWVMASGGDYVNVSGAELVRKLIMRRCSTPLGSFLHLPTYGCAVDPKQILRAQDLRQLKASMEQQILEEPEVQAVVLTLTLAQTGILTIQFSARLRPTGQTVSGSYKVSLATGAVVL